MLVCICKGVPESKIQAVVADGATTVEAVGDACGAGTDCGTCRGAIEELIGECRLRDSARMRQTEDQPSCTM